jgi:hypothetical protein
MNELELKRRSEDAPQHYDFWDVVLGPGETKTLLASRASLVPSDLVCQRLSHTGVCLDSIRLNGEEQLLTRGTPLELFLDDGDNTELGPIDGDVEIALELRNETSHPISFTLEIRALSERIGP